MFFSNVNSFLYLTLAVLHCQLISKISGICVVFSPERNSPFQLCQILFFGFNYSLAFRNVNVKKEIF